jgi:hypothetical protein
MQLLGDFFRDYGTPFATAVAVINTIITVTIGQYFKGSPRARALLVLVSLAFGGIAIAATFYSQNQIVAAAKIETANRVAIREGIGKFIEEGNNLKDKCEDATVPLPTDAVVDWDNRVAAFLNTNLGASYVTRFRDQTGAMPPVVGGPVERRGLWLGTYVRVYRLEQFSQQLPL